MGRPRLPEYLRAYINSSLASQRLASTRRRRRATAVKPLDPSWEESIKQKLRHVEPPSHPESSTRTIFSVPDHVRRGDPSAYEPTVVSIGPIHRDKEGLQITAEHKWSLLRKLLALVGSLMHLSRYDWLITEGLKMMMTLEPEARSCYPEEDVSDLSAEQLAELLLLDGCFIICVLVRPIVEAHSARVPVVELNGAEFHLKDFYGSLHEGNLWVWVLVKYDLLKLENQIPFFVLETLCSLVETKLDLVKLSRQLFYDIHPPVAENAEPAPSNIHHLLHLFHLSILPHSITILPQVPNTMQADWVPSATELREAGVQFKRNDEANSFLEVGFQGGVMQVPRLNIYHYSNAVFRNLIALEQCLPVAPYITSYCLFMSHMLHEAQDVRLLHLAGIIYNGRSSDEEVVQFFNRLCIGVHYAHDANYLSGLFIEVRKYHESPWHNWNASLQREYFSNPWVTLSLVAAGFLLILTFLQTFFTIYSYYRPPSPSQ